jgi:hypothetical protein
MAFVTLFCIFVSFLNKHIFPLNSELCVNVDERIEPYLGHYIGVVPTDESVILYGECDLELGRDIVKIQFATGLKLIEDSFIPEYSIVWEDIDQITIRFSNKSRVLLVIPKHSLPMKNQPNGPIELKNAGMFMFFGSEIDSIFGPSFFCKKNEPIENLVKNEYMQYLPRISFGGKAKQ